MSWRDQLRAGWRILRWLYWPSEVVAPAGLIAVHVASAAAIVGLLVMDSLWPLAGAVVIAMAVGWWGWRGNRKGGPRAHD